MSSQRRIEASRRNGALSRGPKTEAGKSRSSQNALQHGILAEPAVRANESKDDFVDAQDEYVEKDKPRDGVKMAMVEQMATCFWRMQRALENYPHGRQVNHSADAWNELSNAGSRQTIHRYQILDRMEARMQRKLLPASKLNPENPKLPNEPNPISGHMSLEPDDPSLSAAAARSLNQPADTRYCTRIARVKSHRV
jgi:hypothetical protein